MLFLVMGFMLFYFVLLSAQKAAGQRIYLAPWDFQLCLDQGTPEGEHS